MEETSTSLVKRSLYTRPVPFSSVIVEVVLCHRPALTQGRLRLQWRQKMTQWGCCLITLPLASGHLQCRRPGFDPWVGKIPWRRARQPTPVLLLGESPWTEELVRLCPWCHRVGHDWTAKHSTAQQVVEDLEISGFGNWDKGGGSYLNVVQFRCLFFTHSFSKRISSMFNVTTIISI